MMTRNAFHLLVAQIASTVLSIAFSAVMTRMLGAADFRGLFPRHVLVEFA
jgi:O-antigen/teichoic acid export membrane protein